MFDRAILHLDLDAFFVSVECLKNTALRGKPVIIGGTANRGVVSSCSYEARTFGVRSAMPMRLARQLCPDAIVLRGDLEQYAQYSALVREIITHHAPLFEQASIDEFYIDLTGMDKYFGCYQWAKQCREKIMNESGLPISMGLSINKLVSKVATGEAKPAGQQCIKQGTERAFFAPLSVQKIPSVGKVTCRQLHLMGIRTIRVLQQIPVELLERQFGRKLGLALAQKANAIDQRPVVPYNEQKSISTERTFGEDTTDMQKLRSILTAMTTKLAFELREKQTLTALVSVKIRYSDYNTYTKQKRIPYTASDQQLLLCIHHLFDTLYQRRQLIRLVGIRFSGLVGGHYQLNLLEDNLKDIHLMQTMDHIRRRFGADAIKRATTL
ncbi:MAG: DNA polymerase IV [Bacteroidota bacterium]